MRVERGSRKIVAVLAAVRALAAKPALWLAVQMALVIVGIQLRGWGSVHEVPDTQSYLETARMSPAGMLASFRSVGYPIFLRPYCWRPPV